jgi:hypothetical protein
MTDQAGVPSVECLACGRVVACVRVSEGRVIRPIAWIYPDESTPLRGVCGRHIPAEPKPGDEIWRQTFVGQEADRVVRAEDVYKVARVYDDGTIDLVIERTVTTRPHVNQLDVTIGFVQPGATDDEIRDRLKRPS